MNVAGSIRLLGTGTLAASCVNVAGSTRLLGSGPHWDALVRTLSTDLDLCVLGLFCTGGPVDLALLRAAVAFAFGAVFAFGLPL